MASYGTGDRVIFISKNEGVITRCCGKDSHGNTFYRARYSGDTLEFNVYESAIVRLAITAVPKPVHIDKNEVAKAIAMLTRLTYAEALEDLNKNIEAMTRSDGACAKAVEARMSNIMLNSTEGGNDWMWAGKGWFQDKSIELARVNVKKAEEALRDILHKTRYMKALYDGMRVPTPLGCTPWLPW